MDAGHWHVTSSRNRASISEHGLDWTRMAAAPGIAGSTRPEAEGVFLGTEGLSDVHYFCRMNRTGGPVDVWRVDGVDPDALVESSSGYFFLPRIVSSVDLTLEYVDVALPRCRVTVTTEPDPAAILEPFRHHRDGRLDRRRRRRGQPRA